MGWTEALHQTVVEFAGQDFEWGRIDCMQFCARYAELLTGDNPARGVEYDSEWSANRVLAEHGGPGALIGRRLDAQPRPGVPIPGDIVVAEIAAQGEPELMTAGIYNGFYVWTITEARGIVRVNEERIRQAWPVE